MQSNMLSLTAKTGKYDIINRRGGLAEIARYIKEARGVSKIMIVSDENVQDLYLKTVCTSLKSLNFEIVSFAFPAGEQSKTPKTYLQIIDALAYSHFNRGDAVLALGGGVVGDVAGFAAATYMRGIDVIQAPTTLLAAIDSSIGGKTGVDLECGKNLLGAFHQPRLVFFDSQTVDTLPDCEIKNGFGEGFKYAVLKGGKILEIILQGVDGKNIDEFVTLCQKAKAEIVEKDETESGARMLLNLGHTLGHALEKLSGYKIPHGQAVAAGILLMSKSALAAGDIDVTDFKIICSIADKYGFAEKYMFTYDDMLNAAYTDKKMSDGNSISFIKIKGFGKCEICKTPFEDFCGYVKRGAETDV